MLADFQQALADLTASPELCNRARSNPAILRERYELTNREWERLVGIVRHPGMACNCIVYRANRLAPLALNIPRTCKALGSQLRAIVDEFWAAFPEANVHFYIETARFCKFLQAKLDAGEEFAPGVKAILGEESLVIEAALRESRTEDCSLVGQTGSSDGTLDGPVFVNHPELTVGTAKEHCKSYPVFKYPRGLSLTAAVERRTHGRDSAEPGLFG